MGQINIDTNFGKFLYSLASDNQYKTYLEVGTWNGQGSTKCLISGIVEKNPLAKLYSLEANTEMYNKAKMYYTQNIEQLHLIHGVLHKKLVPLDYIEKHPTFYKLQHHGDAYKSWYNNDKEDMENIACFTIPEDSIDVIMLDGGEFSGIFDWEVLEQKNPKVVCMDDSNVFKNYDLRNILLVSDDWELLIDEPDDRNGWCAFKRKSI